MSDESRAVCARCGTLFMCAMQTAQERSVPCWCSSFPPLRPVAGRSCMCRECLELELAQSRTSS